jgi:replicative DNA helicase
MTDLVDIAAEQAVLGAALNDPEAASFYLDDEQVVEDHFSTDAHRSIWRFVVHYLEHGTGDLSGLALQSTLQAHPTLVVGNLPFDDVTIAASTAAATPDAQTGANAEHAKRLRDIAERRRISHEARAAHLDLHRLEVAPEDVAARLMTALSDGQLNRDPRVSAEDLDGVTMAEAIESSIREWESDEHRRYVPTGVGALDKVIGGLEPGRLVTVAARPAMGKSVLGLMLSRQVATATDRHVLHWSIEMSARELAERYVAMSGATTLPALTKHDQRAWQGIDWTRVLALPDHDSAKRLRILGRRPGLTVDDIVRFSRRHHANVGPVGLVVVDYVGLLEATDPRFADDVSKISTATRRLKLLAEELRAPVVAVSQLNRKVDERTSKRPMLSDLRSSGSLEQDSDQVIFVFRPSAYNEADRPGEADLIVAKNRGGRTGDAVVRFEGEYIRFSAMHSGGGAPFYSDVPLPGSHA